MSSSNRTTSKGGKAKADKAHKLDKSDSGKGSGDKQQPGGGEVIRSKSDDPYIKDKVKQVIEMTQRDENEVCLILHECEYDVEMAVNMLFESKEHGTWEMTRKKKNRQTSASKADTSEATQGEDWNETPSHADEKQKPRNKNSSGPPRLHGRHNDSRGWRGRERQENERNLEDGVRNEHRERRARSGGVPRGGGSGRGRGGGRAGSRFPPRGGNKGNFNSRPMETWDNSNTWDNSTAVNTNHADEWSTEEYTGSLADTKVFTPSIQMDQITLDSSTDPSIASTGPVDASGLSATQQLTQALEMRNQLPQQIPTQGPITLNAAQTQYLSQLTQQTSDGMKAAAGHPQQQGYGFGGSQGYGGTSASQFNSQQFGSPAGGSYVNSNYVVNSGFGSVPEQTSAGHQQPVRPKQRARVPPPSKIPSSAVEMPGDVNSTISYLDVQFGAMDFMSDGGAIEGVLDSKFGPNSTLDNSTTPSSNLDLNSTSQNATIDVYTPPKPNTQNSISSVLSQSLSNTDSSIPQTSEHMPIAYNTAAAASRNSTAVSSAPQSVTPSALDLNKQADAHSYSNQSSYSSYQPKSSSFQAQTYNSSSYSTTQTTSSSYASNAQSNSYTNSNTYNAQNATNTYPNSYSSASSYQSNSTAAGFPSISQANSYPTNNQTYQQSAGQPVYGANAGLNSSSNYTGTGSSQYNSYNSATSHKIGKETTYDGSGVTVTSAPTATNVSSGSTTHSLSQSATGTKATTTLAKNSSSVISNIPPGVTPVMSTPYIQVPFFQTPMYAYEDMQLLQQRMPPHMTGPYYDMSYQTPTTLTAVRDGALANVAYSISDGRFTRADNNASPVPSTLSQQTSTLTQGHQAQPILAQTPTHPGWIYPSTYNAMTPGYQFGVMYQQQLPAATNAHGTSNSTQYPKPTTYASGYGSGYEALSQSQDYSKGAYVGNAAGQSKGSAGNSSSTGTAANDLTAMYGKTHASLGKMNSYEKQAFHSGTPPPFTGTLHGNQNAGLAPSGTGYGPQMYIPTMAPHQQHHSTQLIHQPLHQDSGNSSGQRSQVSSQTKSGSKQGYPASYWNQA